MQEWGELIFWHATVDVLSSNMLKQVKESSPWSWLSDELWNVDTQDSRVKFANQQQLVYATRDEILCSFLVLWRDDYRNPAIAWSMKISPNTTATILYLFTPQHYQWSWYATQLVDYCRSVAKDLYKWVETIVWTTSSQENKIFYRDKIWAVLSEDVAPTDIAIYEWLSDDFFFSLSVDR